MQQQSDENVMIAGRLETLRRARKITWGELGKELDLSPTMLYYVRMGKRELGIKAERRLEEFEKVCGVPSRSMAESSGTYKISNLKTNRDGSLAARPVRRVPLISWTQAGQAHEYQEMPKDWQEQIATDCDDADAFAVAIVGDSMEPQFREGEIAIVMPSREARNGRIVVANIKKQGMCLKLFHMAGGDGAIYRLTSYNPAYPPLELRQRDFHWIWPVHSVVKILCR